MLKKSGKKYRRNALDAGFTFMETLAVIALTAVLTAQVGAGIFKLLQKGKAAAAKAQIENYRTALQSFYIDTGHFPETSQGLEILWSNDSGTEDYEKWRGPYTDRKISVDPWGNKYLYLDARDCALCASSGQYELMPDGLAWGIICFGADGLKGGSGDEKDIVSWE